ncbi:MAG: hypothetical protein ACI81P_002595 [Neolewinella sp.]|jgi:hypothetical protein
MGFWPVEDYKIGNAQWLYGCWAFSFFGAAAGAPVAAVSDSQLFS